MDEPSPRSSRLALAGALLAAIAVGGGGFLLGRATTEPAREPAARPVAPGPEKAPEPALSGALDRAGLIALAAAAADAAAGGRVLAPEIAKADGRRFELLLPFGCDGPAADGSAAAMRWRYDAKAEALRISVTPFAWNAGDWWPADAANGVEAIEGFWITRPWTSNEACPAGGDRPAAAGTEPATLPGQTLAIGQIFFDGMRGGRRDGKAYEAVVRIAKGELRTEQGFGLRIRGRIAGGPGGRPVHCRQPIGPEQRPICLVSVVVDEVAVENPAGGQTLAIWSVGGPGGPDG